MQVEREPYGQMADGQVDRYTLTNDQGMVVQILTLGGIIQSVTVPDRTGAMANVVLGFATLEDYLRHNQLVHFGCITGRYANRIGKGQFTIDGQTYQLPINAGPNTLHGGIRGFYSHLWTGTAIEETDAVGVRLTRTSPDGEEGFPGALATTVSYRLTNSNELRIAYDATTDKPTVLTLTNHTYFNLAGEGSGSILHHNLTLHASHFSPTDADGLPLGEHVDVAGTPFDFRKPTAIGSRIRVSHPQIQLGHGYDHNYVIDREQGAECALAPAAWAQDPKTGRTLTVHTTEPGVQFYTGNFLRGNLIGPSGSIYRQSDGFALETEHFPDSPNQPSYPSTVLRPGEQYHSETVFAFGVS